MKMFFPFLALLASACVNAQVATVQLGNTPGNQITRGATDATVVCFAATAATTQVTTTRLRVGLTRTGFGAVNWTNPGTLDGSLANFQVKDMSGTVLALIPSLEACSGRILTSHSWSCEVDLNPSWVFAAPSEICYSIDLAEFGPIEQVALLRGELQVTTATNGTNASTTGFVPEEMIQGPNRVLQPQQVFDNGFED